MAVANGDITGSLFPTRADFRHSITIKIEPDDDDYEPHVVPTPAVPVDPGPPPPPSAATLDHCNIRTREELEEYYNSLPPTGPYFCPFTGCRVRRKLHFHEHLFGRSDRTATCGPLRPATKRRHYRVKAELLEDQDHNHSHQQSVNQQPQSQGKYHQYQVVTPPKRRRTGELIQLGAPGGAMDLSLPHVADIIANNVQNAAPVNGHAEEEIHEWQEYGVRRSGRVKKEPVDLYTSLSVPPQPSARKKGKRGRKSEPVTATTSSSSTSATLPPSKLVNQGTQTDLTVFHMSFMNIETGKRSKCKK